MIDFNFYSPTHFAFGRGRECEAGKLVKQFGGSCVLVLYGGQSAVKSGLLARVEMALKGEQLPYFSLGGIRPNPESDVVYKALDICRRENVDFLLAIGGGSVIDTAKAVAVGAKYEGDFWDFYDYSIRRPITQALPVGVVLTLAATGSEASTDSVISHMGGKLKRSISSDLVRPVFAVMNPELTMTLPAYQTACGVVDMLAHVFERYFSNTAGVELTSRLCEAVMITIVGEAKKVMADPNDYDARANLMWAATIAHNNLLSTGRQSDWASHLIEHELSAMYGCAHGAGLAVVFPAWMKYTVNHDPKLFSQVAVRVWGCKEREDIMALALEGIDAYVAFLKSLGMPTTLAELGGQEADIPKLAANVGFGPYKFGAFVPLGVEETEAILRLAL